MTHQVIHIHPDAPRKPAEGEPCNGCGVCCLAEPCPVGMLVSRKRRGACVALVWSQATPTSPARYQCGLMLRATGLTPTPGSTPHSVPYSVPKAAPLPIRPFMPIAAIAAIGRRLWLAWVRRLISAGSGCDASLVVAERAGASAAPEAKADPK